MEHLTSLIVSLVSSEIRQRRIRMQRLAWGYGVAGFLFLTGYVAIIATVAAYYEQQYGMLRPLLLMTAATIVPALILIAAIKIAKRRQRQRQQELNAQYLGIAGSVFALIPTLASRRGLTLIAAIGILTVLFNKRDTDPDDEN